MAGSSVIKNGTLAIGFVLAACTSPKVEVWLWSDSEVGENVGDDAPIQPHPCGVVERKYLSSLPAEGEAGFEPGSEMVVEHDGAGKLIKIWNTPMEPEVLAIDGSIIFLDYGRTALSIDADGALKETPKRMSQREYVEDCPVRALGGRFSGFLCWNIVDESQGRVRHIAHKIVCT